MASTSIVVNTNSFCEEDLTTFLECSERIMKCEERQRGEWLKKAILTNEEIFETSTVTVTDDYLVKKHEGEQSFLSKSASMEDLMKYFEEDVEVDSDQDVKKLEKNEEFVEEVPILSNELKIHELSPNTGAVKKAIKTPLIDETSSNIKPSDLKAIRWQSSAPSGSYCKFTQNTQLDPMRKFVKLSDLDLIDKNSNKENSPKRFSSSNEIQPRDPTTNYSKRNDNPCGQVKTTGSPKSKAQNDQQSTNELNEYGFKSSNLRSILNGKPPRVNHQHLKPSDLNLTMKEWEERYFKIIGKDLSPQDLNLTQKEWDERYTQIIRNDLKPADPIPSSRVNFEDSKPSKWEKAMRPKKTVKSRVQKIAEMFNGMITQVMKTDQSMSGYERFSNELSPEPAKPPQPKVRTMVPSMAPRHVVTPKASPRVSPKPTPRQSPKLNKRPVKQTGCLIPEDVFNKLSVKDKALLFNKFMREMSRQNPDFHIDPEEFASAIEKKQNGEPEEVKVLTEKQESVMNLARELEARIIFPKQTISQAVFAKPTRTPSKKGPAPQPPVEEKINKEEEKEEEPVHVSKLTVVLKPSPIKVVSSSIGPVLRRKISHSTVVVCPSMKRPNHQIASSIPIEVYAPPRKIRRTRAERSNSKKFTQNPNLEQLFYDWMKDRHGLSFDIQTQGENTSQEDKQHEDIEDNNDKTVETDTTIKNDELEVEVESVAEPAPKTEEALEKSSKTVSKNDPTESDSSSLITMPSSKIHTDESQTDQAKESPDGDYEFLKPVRPPRRKKTRRATLTWKKDASIVEKLQPLSTTDSDSDFKQLGNQQQQKPKKPTSLVTDPAKGKKLIFKDTPSPSVDQRSFEIDDSFLDFMNSPRKIRNAYTLTAMSSPSQKTNSILSNRSEAPAKPPRKGKITPQLPLDIDESKFENDDQGFETGSTGYSPARINHKTCATFSISPLQEKSPLFIKLNTEIERRLSETSQTPSAYSTPVKNNNSNSNGSKINPAKKPSWHTVFSPIQISGGRRKSLADSESRRSSIVMDVIREEQQQQSKKPDSPNVDDDVFISNPATDICRDRKSSFWISIDDLTLSMDIFGNPKDRLSLLSDIFGQKSGECKTVQFGIDDLKYSPKEGAVKEEITKSLPKIEGISHYWFASGDLAVPFQGNFIAPDRVKEIFFFIRNSSAEETQLSFGVDNTEFSKIPEPGSPGPKFSIESSYSMLIGLNGKSNETRNKFTWPASSRNSTPFKTSDFDPSEFDSDSFEVSEIGRLSFSPFGSNYFDMASMQSGGERASTASFASMGSPEMFTFEYENEPLDKMFGKKKTNPSTSSSSSPTNSETFVLGKNDKSIKMPKPLPSTDSMTVDKMIETIRRQQHKLQNLETDMKTYTNPAGFTSSVLDKYHGRPYVRKLHNIVRSIQIIAKTGFENCTAQQLESFLYFLSLYAETCLSSCSNQMNVILEQLRKDKSVQPPENELQKSHDNTTRLSEHQLRVQASLQRLNIPDWFRQYNLSSPKSPSSDANKSVGINSNFSRKRASDSGRWTGLNSKTTSLSSLGSQRSDRSPLLLSPSAHSHHGGQTTLSSVANSTAGTNNNFSGGSLRWSTSILNSTQTSPSVSTRGSFSRGGPINSSFISATNSAGATRSSFRQPYLGWRSQEKLSQPRTPHERLASSLLAQRSSQKPEQPVTPEIQTSIKEVTSAIVHYVNDQTNRTNQRSRSASPNSRKCWLESSFVGIRPVESPQTPIIENSTFSNASTAVLNNSFHNNTTSATSSIHSSIGINNVTTADGLRINGVGAPERTMSSASLEDVLASLLGLPTTQVPATETFRSTGDSASEAIHHHTRMTTSASPSSLQVVDQQARFRRRSEGDAQRQKEQQQQQLEKQQQALELINKANQKPHAAASSSINCHPEPPRRISLDSSESKTTSELQIKCRNTKCDQAATAVDAKKFYKSCHNCSHLYCSRECRRIHWEKHRKACLHSRASNLCRQVLSTCKDDVDTQRHLSLLARKGYLSQGRGVVRALFRSAESAEGFIKNGFQCMGEASYVRWPDLMPAEMGLELYSELLKLSTEYKPDSKMLIYVAICVVSEAPGSSTAAVKWERQLVSRCAKLKLCKSILTELENSQQQIVMVPEPATEILILTFNPSKCSNPSQREVILTNILTILSRRGVMLKKHYPEIHLRLQTYADGQTDRFNAVTLHPRDSQTGQGFVCIIMPLQSDGEIIKMPCSDGGNKVSTIDVGEELMES